MEIHNNGKRKLKVCYAYRTKAKHPLINLAGRYLSQFGFNVGDFVELTIEKGLITIKKVTDTS